MRAVSNTSPLSALASIGRLSLLFIEFHEIWIPPAVAAELANHPNSAASSEFRAALQNQTLRVSAPLASSLLNILSQELHLGEAEAIALALELQADVLLMDEREGRRFATQLGLFTTGVLGIVLRAKLRGDVPNLKAEIRSLRNKARFFISNALEAELLAAGGE